MEESVIWGIFKRIAGRRRCCLITSNAQQKIMGSIPELSTRSDRRMERLKGYYATAEERLPMVDPQYHPSVLPSYRLWSGDFVVFGSPAPRLASFLDRPLGFFSDTERIFCSLGYLACFYGLCKALIRQEFRSRTARCLWPGFFIA